MTVLRAGGRLSSRLAGRIAAEWPALFVVRQPGAGRSLLCPRGRTGGAIFTTRQAAQQLIDEGGCEQPAEVVGFVPHWGDSPFELMVETYREAWMDPDSSGGGLHLDTERLQPRVPWFIA